ncbi:MAG TPA: type IV toxin-antitoxin system AbiEi family antitoxin domain-containing protein [Acidimicrobiales bacterium]|nr:type IV toxin-antitoxin system AbiEi family antitoxin domain-containing protein [Acidimicrobiales bacterium]
MSAHPIDVRVARLASRHLGLVTRPELLRLGLTARQIDLRVERGFLEVVHRGVYRVASAPPSWEQRVLAATLAGGARAVASHRTAGQIFRLRGIEHAPVEILVPRERRVGLDGVIVHRTTALHRPDVARRGLIPITTPARTLFDMAAVIDMETLESALEDAVLQHLASWQYLMRAAERLAGRGHPGSGLIVQLLRERDPETKPTESTLEDEVVRLLRRAGLPAPERQIELWPPGFARPVRFDLGYRPQKLLLEVDSRRWHGARKDVERNSAKANIIVAAGYRALHFTKDDVRRRPDYLVGCVDRELLRGAPRLWAS